MAPNNTYVKTAIVPLFPPKRPTAIKTANVCKVNGTVAGMEIQEQIAITATKSPIYAMSTVRSAVVFVCAFMITSPLTCLIYNFSLLRIKDCLIFVKLHISILTISISYSILFLYNL